MAQRAEHKTPMTEVRGLILTEITFFCWTFLFLHSKASDANIVIIANFVCL